MFGWIIRLFKKPEPKRELSDRVRKLINDNFERRERSEAQKRGWITRKKNQEKRQREKINKHKAYWTPERRAAQSEKVRAMWAAKKRLTRIDETLGLEQQAQDANLREDTNAYYESIGGTCRHWAKK